MSQTSFDDRLNRVTNKHDNLSVGVTYRIGPDGLITAHPVRRVSIRFPLKALFFTAAVGFAFKVLLFVGLGEGTYTARLNLLAEGTTVERAAAWAMRPDSVTRALGTIAGQMSLR